MTGSRVRVTQAAPVLVCKNEGCVSGSFSWCRGVCLCHGEAKTLKVCPSFQSHSIGSMMQVIACIFVHQYDWRLGCSSRCGHHTHVAVTGSRGGLNEAHGLE